MVGNLTSEDQNLRDAFSTFATGVTVVTTLDSAGNPVGFTANSFTSVSLEPAMLLICMSRKSRSFAAMTNSAGFSVNILSKHQQSISRNFSQMHQDRFENSIWHAGPSGYPLIDESAAWFDCRREQIIQAGDHIVLLGTVLDFGSTGNAPLILCQSSFQN